MGPSTEQNCSVPNWPSRLGEKVVRLLLSFDCTRVDCCDSRWWEPGSLSLHPTHPGSSLGSASRDVKGGVED